MKKKRLVATTLILGTVATLCFYRSPPLPEFVPFDEAQIQEHHTSAQISTFYQRLHKRKWRQLRRLYKDQLEQYSPSEKTWRIPTLIHLMQTGDQPPPYAISWKEHHPDWEVRLWTPEQLETLHPMGATKEDKLAFCRLAILSEYGGVVIDQSLECLKPLDTLHKASDFYAGLEGEVRSPNISPNVIGSSKAHPIILKSLDSLTKKEEMARRLSHALTHSFFSVSEEGSHKVLLPASYFSADEKAPTYSLARKLHD
jgi:mannosyltransferase OCH1-like enzyme